MQRSQPGPLSQARTSLAAQTASLQASLCQCNPLCGGGDSTATGGPWPSRGTAPPGRSSPVPDPSGSTASTLNGVSCRSAISCTAVGDSNNGTNEQTLVESWNGTAWSISRARRHWQHRQHPRCCSCLRAISCTAVGYSSSNGTTYQTLVESWDGTTWSIIPSPSVTGSTDSILRSLSCLVDRFARQ